MLIITGLLTLLAISQAGGDGIKGGTKGGSLFQEQVAQEDIPSPYSYNIKTGSTYGTKVTRDETGDADGRIKGSYTVSNPRGTSVIEAMSKKAPAPSLQRSVKTVADRSSKTQVVPGLHHAATSPVVQDQVVIDEPVADTRGIKTLKTISSGKTRFSQTDRQVRDPVARPVVQTVKTVQEPAADSSQGLKTLKTAVAGKTRFSEQDKQVRDPVARPVIQTIKTVQEPATESSQGLKTLKTVDTGKTRFSEQDKQVRDPTARPVVQTIQSTADPATDSIKTLKTVPRSKTRFSQTDTQVRDPVARPVIQTVKSTRDPSINQQTVKTSTKTAEPSTLRRKTIKSSQQNAPSTSTSNVPESVVEAARRNTLRTLVPESALTGNLRNPTESENAQNVQLFSVSDPQIQSTFGSLNEKGEITIDEETIKYLQNAGGIVTENGEITLNEEGIRLLQNVRGSTFDPSSPFLPGATYGSNAEVISGFSRTSYDTEVEERKQDAISTRPLLRVTELGQTMRVSNDNRRQPSRNRVTGSQVTNNSGLNSRSQITLSGQRGAPTSISRGALRSQGTSAVRPFTTTTNAETILFNGREISVGGLRAGQLFDENLQPILTDKVEISRPADLRASPIPEIPKPASSPAFPQGASVPSVGSRFESSILSTGGGTRRRQQAANIPKDKMQLRTPARPQSTITGQPNTQTSLLRGGLRSQGATGIRQSSTGANAETVLFNGREISVGGLRAGQLFDENLQPILTDNAEISRPADIRASPIPEIPKPASSPAFPQGASVSTIGSRFESNVLSTGGGTRRRQQAVNIPKDKLKLRTPARPQTTFAVQPNVQTSISRAGLRSQGAAGIRQSTTATNAETILFNGKEISLGGLRAGQLFDENLQPILTDKAEISRPADIRSSPIPQIPKPASSPAFPQGVPVSTVGSRFESSVLSTGGGTRRRQQAVNIPKDKVQLRTQARPQTTFAGQPNVQTSISRGGLRSQGATGIRQSSTGANAETILFNGREISVDGLRAGQLFDENLQPILTDKVEISRPADIRTSPIPEIPKPASSPAFPQGASVSTVGSRFESSILRTGGGTRRRQQVVNIPKDKVQLRTPARPQSTFAGQPNAQTSISRGGLRSQGATGISQSTTGATAETVLFNGREISVGGLRAGQLFDENLQPILTDKAEISRPADVRASPIPEIPKPASSPAFPQGASVSTVGSRFESSVLSTGGGTRRRQQAVNIPKDKVQLRTQARPQTTFAGQPNVQTSISRGGLRSQGATGIRQSTTGVNAEKVLFNGKEISVDGLRTGQLFDENLQPILTDKAEISRPAGIRSSPIPEIPKPASSPAFPQGASVSTDGSRFGSSILSTGGGTRRRQQAVNIPKDKLKLRTPARPQTTFAGQPNVQTSISRAGLRSQGAAGMRQSTTATNAETILFNGKEISVDGLRAGQLFDENLQPILTEKAEISRPAGIRSSPIPEIPKPASSPAFPQGASVSTDGSRFGSSILSTGGGTRRRQQAVNIPKDKLKLRTPARPQTTFAGQPNVQTSISRAGLRSQGAAGMRQSTTATNAETILFNGKEISVDGLRAGQLFDENLQPILTDKAEISRPADIRSSPIPQIPKPASSPAFPQSTPVSTVGSRFESSILSTGGGTRRRQQSVNTPKDKVQLRTQARPQTTFVGQPNVQTSISRGGLRSQGATGIRQSSTGANAETILFNGREISVDGLRAGQLFDENLQPILTDEAQISRPAGIRSSPIPKPASSPAFKQNAAVSAISSNFGSRRRLGSSATISSQPGTNLRGEMRTSGVISSTFSETSGAAPSRIPGAGSRTGTLLRQQSPTFSRRNPNVATGRLPGGNLPSLGAIPSEGAGLTSSGLPVRQIISGSVSSGDQGQTTPQSDITKPVAVSNAETILFNGKEISIGGLREGQLFDENLQPILSGNVESAAIEDFKAQSIPQDGRRTSRPGTLQNTAIRTATVFGQPNVQTGVSRTSLRSQGITRIRQPSPGINDDTIFFNGKEVRIGGLRAGQIFDENLRPILSGNLGSANTENIGATGRLGSSQRSAVSGTRTGSQPQRLSAAGVRRSGGSSVGGTVVQGSRGQSVSRTIPQIPNMRSTELSPGLATQNIATGIFPLNSGDIASIYTSGSGSRGSDIQRKFFQDSITQEISQDRVETPVIQEKQDIPVVPQYSMDSQQKIQVPIYKMSQKTLEPTETKQTQVKVEDVIEQSSLTKPAVLKTVQVQETIPFSVPKTPSKKTFTKISQVSQKDIDIPTVQQRDILGDFSGYLPKASFLPPFNYGLPQVYASKYGAKIPIVQEQQKVEQEFV